MNKHEAWRRLLQGDAGLANTQEKILEEISIKDIPYEKLQELQKLVEGNIGKYSEGEPAESIHDKDTLSYIEYTNLWLVEATTNLTNYSLRFHPSSYENYATDLVVVAAVLREITAAYLSSKKYIFSQPIHWDDKELKELMEHVMLDSKEEIALDNIQVLLDVFRVFTHGETDISKKYKIINHMCTKPFSKRIVKKGETVLEICARAPFYFWSNARNMVPIGFNGKPLIKNGTTYNEEFLRHIATGKSATFDGTHAERHGGCPVLHKDFSELDLINRLGQQFADLYKRMYVDCK